MAAGTRDAALILSRGFKLQQFGHYGGPRQMHGRAHRRLDGFQIETTRLSMISEDHA
jgi:hypothetical protein